MIEALILILVACAVGWIVSVALTGAGLGTIGNCAVGAAGTVAGALLGPLCGLVPSGPLAYALLALPGTAMLLLGYGLLAEGRRTRSVVVEEAPVDPRSRLFRDRIRAAHRAIRGLELGLIPAWCRARVWSNRNWLRAREWWTARHHGPRDHHGAS